MKWFSIYLILLLAIYVDFSFSNKICLVELIATPYIASSNNETDGPDRIGFQLNVCRLEGERVEEVIINKLILKN